MTAQRIIDSVWITSLDLVGCIGIVVIENDTGDRKAYVGWGDGYSEERDAERIARDGGKITAEILEHVVDLLRKGGE